MAAQPISDMANFIFSSAVCVALGHPSEHIGWVERSEICHDVLFWMDYNFVRIHKTLRVTPAMAAGVTDRLWEIGDVVDMLEAWEAK